MGKTENLVTLEKTEGREKREIRVPLEEKVLMVPRVSVGLLDRRDPRVSRGRLALLARVSLVSQELWVLRVTVERLDPKGNRAFLESEACEENPGARRVRSICWELLASRCRSCGRFWTPGMRVLVASCLCLSGDPGPRGTLVIEALQARTAPSVFLENVG